LQRQFITSGMSGREPRRKRMKTNRARRERNYGFDCSAAALH